MEAMASLSARRAWIEIRPMQGRRFAPRSLSARRAWIEILLCGLLSMLTSVALRKESVDRNTNPGSTALTFPGSLSARRAWIEIMAQVRDSANQTVALRKESVDRNWLLQRLQWLLRVALRKESVDRNQALLRSHGNW